MKEFQGRFSVDIGLVNEILFEILWVNHQKDPPVRLVSVYSATSIERNDCYLFKVVHSEFKMIGLNDLILYSLFGTAVIFHLFRNGIKKNQFPLLNFVLWL